MKWTEWNQESHCVFTCSSAWITLCRRLCVSVSVCECFCMDISYYQELLEAYQAKLCYLFVWWHFICGLNVWEHSKYCDAQSIASSHFFFLLPRTTRCFASNLTWIVIMVSQNILFDSPLRAIYSFLTFSWLLFSAVSRFASEAGDSLQVLNDVAWKSA